MIDVSPIHKRAHGFSQRAATRVAEPYLMVAGLCSIMLFHVWHLACVAEDAHITFRFARNLADGHGFVWNIGERPIEGFTTFLWVLVSAAGLRAGIDLFWLTQTLGTLSTLGTLALTFELARRRFGASNWIAFVPCLFLAVSGPFATWAGSGMEMTTFGFFVLLGVYAYLTFLHGASTGWLLASGASLCIATLLRPEGAVVFGVLAGMAATIFSSRTWAAWRPHLAFGIIFALPLVVFVAWRFAEFGDLLPNTFYQKTGGGFWHYARGAGYLIFFGFYYLLPLVPFPALVAWEVGLPDVRRFASLRYWVRLANQHEAAATCAVLTLVYFAAILYEGGDYMAMYRFMVPLLPFVYLLLVPMLQRLAEATARVPHKVGLTVATVAVAAGATLFHSTPFERSFFRVATWQHGNYRGVQSERRYVARFVLIGRFFEEYRKSNSEALATRSIGAIGYYAKSLAIHDLSGLTDRHIARVPTQATNRGWAGHEKWDLDYSFQRLPTYVMLDENLVPRDISGSTRAGDIADALAANYPAAERYANWIREHPDFIEQNYRLVTAWLDDRVNNERGYLAFLERRSPQSAN